jgi:hypothetical protein
MMTIRNARRITGVLVTAALLSACGSREPETYLSAAEIDKGCILTASDRLRQIIHLDANEARALPSPTGMDARLVELDATNMKMSVTYVFFCLSRHGYFSASPMGRK